MKIYALSGVWDDYQIIGISLSRKAIEEQKKVIEQRYRAEGGFIPDLTIEEIEITDDYLPLC